MHRGNAVELTRGRADEARGFEVRGGERDVATNHFADFIGQHGAEEVDAFPERKELRGLAGFGHTEGDFGFLDRPEAYPTFFILDRPEAYPTLGLRERARNGFDAEPVGVGLQHCEHAARRHGARDAAVIFAQLREVYFNPDSGGI